MEEAIKNSANFIYNDFKVYSIFNAIAIYNAIILSGEKDKILQQKVKNYIKENIKYVLKSNYCLLKKIQIYIFNYNIHLYSILIKFLRG